MTRKRRVIDVVTVVVGVVTAVVSPKGLAGAGVFAVLVVLGLVTLDGEVDAVSRWVHAVLTVFSVWSLVASWLFTGPAQAWLVLAGGIGVAVLGLIDLIVPLRGVPFRALVAGSMRSPGFTPL